MIKQIAKLIKQADKIALFHHSNIDGDSISSSYGLLLALKRKFPNKEIVWVVNEEYLFRNFPHLSFDKEFFATKIDESYLAIIGDTCILERIENSSEFIKAKQKICFDHHRADINFKADAYWSEPTWVASAMQAIYIAKSLKVPFDEESAFFLMIGLLSDSGNFAFSLADPKPVELYAEMISHITNKKMDDYFNASREKTKIDIEALGVLLKSIEYTSKTSYVFVSKELVKKYGRELLKSKINMLGNIKDFPIWAMFIEKEKPIDEFKIEVHLRSNGPAVNTVATKFGGGGHARACGAKIKSKQEMYEVLDSLDFQANGGK